MVITVVQNQPLNKIVLPIIIEYVWCLIDSDTYSINLRNNNDIEDLCNWCEERWGPQYRHKIKHGGWSFIKRFNELRLPVGVDLTEFKLTWL